MCTCSVQITLSMDASVRRYTTMISVTITIGSRHGDILNGFPIPIYYLKDLICLLAHKTTIGHQIFDGNTRLALRRRSWIQTLMCVRERRWWNSTRLACFMICVMKLMIIWIGLLVNGISITVLVYSYVQFCMSMGWLWMECNRKMPLEMYSMYLLVISDFDYDKCMFL